jgi:phosphopantothenoylcysteine decarboxylase/phosphopantothenate--cysteine ligase
MSILSGKKILLGISGGIAAYKTPSLVRLLVKKGAEVKVVMTTSSKDFVTPLTLSTLSNNTVFDKFISDKDQNPLWNNHVEISLWADLMIIAPATANIISSMANAQCNNIVIAAYLSSQCDVYIAPSMDLDMYSNPATKNNLKKLEEFGNIVLDAPEGSLVSGLEGKGRLMEPENIIEAIETIYRSKLPLYDKEILITAGPTHEHIDPVRYIGNYSSGLMGYELAKTALSLGAKVNLVSGPTNIILENDNLNLIRVISAQEMFEEVKKIYNSSDIVISAAAVSDFTPVEVFNSKIKKENYKEFTSISLKKTIDILGDLGKNKNNQFLVGFALETEDEITNAKLKLKSKNLDAIVLNSLNEKESCFGGEMNKIIYINKNSDPIFYNLKEKKHVAQDIFRNILTRYEKIY